jgi:pilus assembly protein CpaE
MKDAIRVILVDPAEDSRQTLQRLLTGLGSIWLTEACPSYRSAGKAVAEQRPDLVIVALDSDPEAAIGLVSELARSQAGTAILPASQTRDGDLILRVMRAGAREFLTLPADPQELLGAIGRLVRPDSNGDAPRLGGRVITLAGASGGIGCTSIAVHLASLLAKDPKQSIALVDFDLLLGAVDACLDIVPDYTLLEVCQNSERLDLTLLKRSLIRHGSGVYVLPRPIALEDAARIDPEALRRVVSLLKSAFSTVVIDASKGLQASDFVAYEMSDLIFMVVQLELTCLRNTARLLQLFRQSEGLIDRVRVLVNRSGFRDCEISPKKAEETLNLPISWQVPNALHEFNQARARGVPLDVAAPGCRALRSLKEIARSLNEPESKPASKSQTGLARIAAMFM